jgi:putative exporter of polyketide antibiotics
VDAETSKIVSDYTRLTLGFFQCAQMVELTFRIKALQKATEANFDEVEETLKSQITVLYKNLNLIVLVVLLIGLAFAGLLPELFRLHKTREIETFVVWYFTITGIIYLSLAILFVVTLVKLLKKLKQEETQTKFQSGRVKLVSTTFALAYSFHTVIFIWATFQLYLKGVGTFKDKSSLYITLSWVIG